MSLLTFLFSCRVVGVNLKFTIIIDALFTKFSFSLVYGHVEPVLNTNLSCMSTDLSESNIVTRCPIWQYQNILIADLA